MVSAEGKVPWHGLGTVIEDAGMKSAQALELGGLDWEVDKVPSFVQAGTDEDDNPIYRMIDGTYHIQRSTDNRVLGTVGERYRTLQNKDAFLFGDDLLDASGAHWVTAGSLKHGQTVWMMAKLPETVSLTGYEDEDIQPYILVSNSHDGSSAVTAAVTPVRVVCNNTLTMALRGTPRAFKVRHTINMSGRINEAKRALGITHGYMKALADLGKNMLNEKLSMDEFDTFLESLVPTEGKEKMALTKAQDKQEGIKTLYTNKDDIQNIKGTKWGALQAVIDYNDHHIKGRGEDQAEKRMRRILNQPNLTHAAFKLLA